LLNKYAFNPQTRKVGVFLVLHGVLVCGLLTRINPHNPQVTRKGGKGCGCLRVGCGFTTRNLFCRPGRVFLRVCGFAGGGGVVFARTLQEDEPGIALEGLREDKGYQVDATRG